MITSIILSLIIDLQNPIAMQESGNNPNAYMAREQSAGLLQIRPILVQDLRQHGYNFILKDRWNREKSYQMFTIYLTIYGKQYYKDTGKMPTAEVLARIWNGGPHGWHKPSTIKYWREVKARMDK